MNRYSRQSLYLGKAADEKLRTKSVLIAGVGALGSVLAELFARAGINLVLVDRDFVDETNLQRQSLFTEEDIGESKAFVAKKRIEAINSKISVEAFAEDLTSRNIERFVSKVDLVVDGLDNQETRFLLNDACKKLNKPVIFSSAIGEQGHSLTVKGNFPCFECVFEHLPKPGVLGTCDTVGVLASTTFMMASFAFSEGLKVLTNKALSESLFYVDLSNNEFESLKVKKKKGCNACSGVYKYLDKGVSSSNLCGTNKFQVRAGHELDLKRLGEKLISIGKVSAKANLLHFSIDGKTLSLFENGRVIVSNVSSESEARSLVSRFIGV